MNFDACPETSDDDFVPVPLIPECDDLEDVITERMRAVEFAAADMPGVQ